MKVVKCAFCKIQIAEEKCEFATQIREIEGQTYCFCCEHHASEFETVRSQGRKRT